METIIAGWALKQILLKHIEHCASIQAGMSDRQQTGGNSVTVLLVNARACCDILPCRMIWRRFGWSCRLHVQGLSNKRSLGYWDSKPRKQREDNPRRKHAIAQLVEALRYKPEGRGFDSRCQWNFSLT
jgi:hypothetical protein